MINIKTCFTSFAEVLEYSTWKSCTIYKRHHLWILIGVIYFIIFWKRLSHSSGSGNEDVIHQDGSWRLCFLHHSLFSGGGGLGVTPTWSHTFNTHVVKLLLLLFQVTSQANDVLILFNVIDKIMDLLKILFFYLKSLLNVELPQFFSLLPHTIVSH